MKIFFDVIVDGELKNSVEFRGAKGEIEDEIIEFYQRRASNVVSIDFKARKITYNAKREA